MSPSRRTINVPGGSEASSSAVTPIQVTASSLVKLDWLIARLQQGGLWGVDTKPPLTHRLPINQEEKLMSAGCLELKAMNPDANVFERHLSGHRTELKAHDSRRRHRSPA